jgi:thioredoxin reductase
MAAIADPDVAIVGAGPSGLAAARLLLDHGIGSVVVIERDDAPGGLPRFCRHPGFGFAFSRRIESGPAFVRRLLRGLETPRLRLLTGTTALRVGPGPHLDIVGPETGAQRLAPHAVLLATGIREQPRGARLIPGDRPEAGILTTGLLQQMVARGIRRPLGRMVVVGSEHVAFSAIQTARHGGGRVVALIEPEDRIQSFAWAGLLATHLLGVAIHRRSTVAEIIGRGQVEAVILRGPAGAYRIACDSLLFSAGWSPDAAVLNGSPVAIDRRTGGPIIDQMMRSTLPGVFAAGNVLRGVESSGVAALEGARAAACIAAYLARELSGVIGQTQIDIGPQIQYIVPQRWAAHESDPAQAASFRSSMRVTGDRRNVRIRLRSGPQILWESSRRRLLSSRRIPVSLTSLDARMPDGRVVVEIVPEA